MEIQVETQSGPWGDPEPNAFFLGRRRVGVVTVLDRWLSREHGYFKVVGDDGGVYILRFDSPRGEWEMTLFQRAQQPQ